MSPRDSENYPTEDEVLLNNTKCEIRQHLKASCTRGYQDSNSNDSQSLDGTN